MIGRFLKFLRKEEEAAASTLRLDSTVRWIRGQKKEEVDNHINMLKTAFEQFPELLSAFHKLATQLDEARLRTEDFPDAPSVIVRYKIELAQQAKKIIEDMQTVVYQETKTLDDYENSLQQLQQHLDALQTLLASRGESIRRYFSSHIQTFKEYITAVKRALSNIHDILTSPAIESMAEIKTHVQHALDKIERRKAVKVKLDELQQKIDQRYAEFLNYQTKIRDIKESKRYRLETSLPKNQRSSSIGHFSVLEQEIKEIAHRKKTVEEVLNRLNEDKEALLKSYEALDIHRHLDRIILLIHQLTKMDVEIVHDDV